MSIDIENITKIINQVTGLDFKPKEMWGHNGYKFSDKNEQGFSNIYITVDEAEDDMLIFNISIFEKDMQVANALKLVYPNAIMWMIRYA